MTDQTFSTDLLASDSMPEADRIEYRKLDRHHANILIITWLLVWASVTITFSVIITVTGVESSVLPRFALYLLPLLALPFIIIICRRAAAVCGYAVREQDVHYRSGIIWRGETSLPFNRIQHVEISRDVLERFFGLSTLKFFAAGGGSADLSVPALKEEDAVRLRAFVLEKVGADHNDD